MTTTPTDRDLLPCPFCGGAAELRQDFAYNTGEPLENGWHAICPPCDLIRDQAWAVTRENAIQAWNTRATPDRAEIEAATIARLVEQAGVTGEELADKVVAAANIVTHDGFYEIDVDAVSAILNQALAATVAKAAANERARKIDDGLVIKFRSALRFAASYSVISAEEEKAFLDAIITGAHHAE